jgi:hypothetical protein
MFVAHRRRWSQVVGFVVALAAFAGVGSGVASAASQLTLWPNDVNFGGVMPGRFSDSRVFTVTNIGDEPAPIYTLAFGGLTPGDFSVTRDDCGRSVEPGRFCNVAVTFQPSAVGERSAQFIVGTTGVNPNAWVAGLGSEGAAVGISPTEHVFEPTPVGVRSGWQSFTVSNNGPEPATIDSINVVGANASDFPLDADDCTVTNRGVIPAFGSCTVLLNFIPTTEGERTATIQVTTDGGDPTSAVRGLALRGPA